MTKTILTTAFIVWLLMSISGPIRQTQKNLEDSTNRYETIEQQYGVK